MPELTNDDAASGVIGFTVVRARRNDMTPATLKPTPTRPIAIAIATRVDVGIRSDGAIKEIPHMATAINAATTGGGILSSSDFTRALKGPNAGLNCTTPQANLTGLTR